MAEAVPTVADLVKRGMALPANGRYLITPEGQALIYDAQKRNAAEFKATRPERTTK